MSSQGTIEDLTKSIAQLSLDHKNNFKKLDEQIKSRDSRIDQLILDIKSKDKRIEELHELFILVTSINDRDAEAKLENKLQAVPKLKKTHNFDFYNYFIFWTTFKKILIENQFEEFVENVEAQNKSFIMNNESEAKVIGMIRKTVEPGFQSIVDVNNILPNDEALTAVAILLRLKDRAIGNNPTEENFKSLFRKMKLGTNYHDIDDYFIKIHTLHQQIKLANVNLTENVIAGILFGNLGGPYLDYVRKINDDLREVTDTSEIFHSIHDFEKDINIEYKRIKFQSSSADVGKDYTQKRNKNQIISSSNNISNSNQSRLSRTRGDNIKSRKFKEINNSEIVDNYTFRNKRSTARLHTCNN